MATNRVDCHRHRILTNGASDHGPSCETFEPLAVVGMGAFNALTIDLEADSHLSSLQVSGKLKQSKCIVGILES